MRLFRTGMFCMGLALGVCMSTASAAPKRSLPSPPAVSAPAKTSDVERLTVQLEQMLPFNRYFEHFASKDPKWPLQDVPKDPDPEQLRCLRAELSSDGYHRYMLAKVQVYAEQNPSRVRSDAELLEKGASAFFGRLMDAGFEKAEKGGTVEPENLLKQLSPDEMMSFYTFFNDPNYAPLRSLTGIGDALIAGGSGAEKEGKGKQVGEVIAAQIMLKAMSTCKVPMSAIME